MQRFRESRDRGCAHLVEQQRPDGGLGSGLGDYCQALWALGACGENGAGGMLCDWVRREGMTAEGDFIPRSGMASGYPYVSYNAWTIMGAHRLGQFDVAERGMSFLTDFWDSRSGGFYSSAIQRNAETKQDMMVVALCGLAGLYLGRKEIAEGAGHWLSRVMADQPNFPEQLFTCWSRANGLYTVPQGDDGLRYVVRSDAGGDQPFSQPGAAAAFLARLHQSTGDLRWLELAKEYLRTAEHAGEHVYRSSSAGQVGWASALVYALTGDDKYRGMAQRIGDNLIAIQSVFGQWASADDDSTDTASTSERVIWMDEIQQALAGE